MSYDIEAFCPACGKEVEEKVTLESPVYHSCDACDARHLDIPDDGKCVTCGEGKFTQKELAGDDRIPAKLPCDDCQGLLALQKTEVLAGGIYYQCESCGSSGAIPVCGDSNDIIEHVRKQSECVDPDPETGIYEEVGVSLPSCPACSK